MNGRAMDLFRLQQPWEVKEASSAREVDESLQGQRVVWGRDVKLGVLITQTVVTTAEVDDTSQGEHGD